MQKRRVGTLPMAILLIASGIVMLISQFYKFSAISTTIRWYPIIPILLGGEILWYIQSSKEDKPKIQYDIFSIFIICIVVLFNFTFYGLLEVDLFPRLNTMISSQNYILKTPVKEFEIDNSINKIIIDAPRMHKLIIRTNNDNNIVASGTASITANNKETAKKLLTQQNIHTNASGDTLYISFDGNGSGNSMIERTQMLDYMLIIPTNKQVEINNGNDIELLVGTIENNWVIDNCENTDIRLTQDADVKVKAFVDSAKQLSGNIKWQIYNKPDTTQEALAQGAIEDSSNNVKGEFARKNGKYQVNIINNNSVTINDLSL